MSSKTTQKALARQFMGITSVDEKQAMKVSRRVYNPSSRQAGANALTAPTFQLLKAANWKLEQACDR